MSPEQTQGLLNFSAALAKSSGPSRFPTSGAQGLAEALQGYQQGVQGYQDRATQQQLQSLRLKGLQGELDDQERARKKAIDFDEAARDAYQTPAQQALAYGGGPTVENAARIPQMQGGFDADAFLRKGMAIDPQRAMQFAQQFKKAGPKVKDWREVQQDGKVMYAPFFEDGTHGDPVPLEVARKMEFRDTGGKTVGLDPYTGKVGASVANTISPSTAASNALGWANYNLSKTNAQKPTYNADAGGFVYAPTKESPQGGFVPVAGIVKPADKQKITDANDVLSILDQAEPLIKTATGSYGGVAVDQAARLFGSSTAGSQDAAKLKALEGNLVSKMPKMSGPQSDKDVAMYRQMAGQIGDPTVPVADKQAAIETIKEIAARNAGKKYISLSDIAETARRSGKTTAEVTAAAHDKGYVIGGQ
jgi:hypothetical protein